MPPDTEVPEYWVVDTAAVRDLFERCYEGGFNLTSMPIALAWENAEDVFLLDDGSRYLFWFGTSDEMAEIITPIKLKNIMTAFTFSVGLKLRWIDDPLKDIERSE